MPCFPRRLNFSLSLILGGTLLWFMADSARADTPAAPGLRLPAVFSDNMVLQRDRPNPFWGWAAPGEKVALTVGERTVEATADAAGKWRTELTPPPVGGPYEIAVAAGAQKLLIKNVLVGDVWLGSGQSNMGWPTKLCARPEQELPAAKFPRLRLFKVRLNITPEPQTDVTASWQECSPETVGDFSAVAYFFGRELHQHLDIPIGMIQSEKGGSAIEPWFSRAAIESDPELAELRASLPTSNPAEYEALRLKNVQAVAEWQKAQMPTWTPEPPAWAALEFDDAAWMTLAVPGQWEANLGDFDGVVDFRKVIDLPAEWRGQELALELGAIDDWDQTFVGGRLIGTTGGETPSYWSAKRSYIVPAELTKAEKLVLAVRVADIRGGGGFTGPEKLLTLRPTGAKAEPLSLVGPWRCQIETKFDWTTTPRPPEPPADPKQAAPTTLYNGMIAPLAGVALKGMIWYQGESNAGNAAAYRIRFPAMIRHWRAEWGQGDFPFLFVQLANYTAHRPGVDLPLNLFPSEPGENNWANLRESQLKTLSVPGTGMAVAIDVGEDNDIHPRNKQTVSRRLALAARAVAYGEKLVYSGPIYESLQVEGNAIRLKFASVGGGLVAKGGPLHHFAVAGADKRFVWASAKIDGETVLVSSPEVASPVAVRYAWAINPLGANLYNAEGLPASPFRTDEW